MTAYEAVRLQPGTCILTPEGKEVFVLEHRTGGNIQFGPSQHPVVVHSTDMAKWKVAPRP